MEERKPIFNTFKKASKNPLPDARGELVRLEGRTLLVPFAKNPTLTAAIKTLSNRKLVDDYWEIPLSLDSIDNLRRWNYRLSNSIWDWIDREEGDPPILDHIPGVKRPLLPYQLDGVSMLDHTRGHTIIGDQQGLGKTAQLLAYLQLNPELRPAVIVCPSNAKWGYFNEAKYILSNRRRVEVISGKWAPGSNLKRAHIYIINYEILYITKPCPVCGKTGKVEKKKDGRVVKDDNGNVVMTKCKKCSGKGILPEIRPDIVPHLEGLRVVGLDECQKLQEMDSLRTQAVKLLCDYLPEDDRQIIPSSGTPILHRPKNFFVALNLVRPDLFPVFQKFGMRFCGGKQKQAGKQKVWDFNGASNQDVLFNMLKRYKVLLRRTKDEVLPQLPKMTRTIVPIELDRDDWREYADAESDFLGWLADKDPEKLPAAERAEALVKINTLKQLAIRFKLNSAIDWINDFLETGEKLIVFCHHSATVDALKTSFGDRAVVVDGGTSDIQKRDAETEFQACRRCGVKKDKHDLDDNPCASYIPNKTQLFLGTKAAKEALTLTAASDTVFIELYDSPKDHEQAEERCYGRVSDPHGATSWYLIAKDTIEEDFLGLHDKKRANIDSIIDGRKGEESSSLLDELLGQYKAKRKR